MVVAVAVAPIPVPSESEFALNLSDRNRPLLPQHVRPMFSLIPSNLRGSSAACLILGLVAGAELALPGASVAGQPNVPPCQQSQLVASASLAQAQAGTGAAASTSSGSLLAQALPGQPAGPELGEPACTYDPTLPAPRQIIRGLW